MGNSTWSLPVRECGLKCIVEVVLHATLTGTPRAGVWIEIKVAGKNSAQPQVTPRAGVWIEILDYQDTVKKLSVTPRAGVWIEIRVSIDRS